MRRNSLNTWPPLLIPLSIRRTDVTQQRRQGKEILEPERCAPGGDPDERIDGRDIRPSDRQRPRTPVGAHVHHAVLAPVKPVGQQLKRLAVQRMEWMGDRENVWEMRITRCNARLTPIRTLS